MEIEDTRNFRCGLHQIAGEVSRASRWAYHLPIFGTPAYRETT